jgi:hypothetical protein
MTSSFLPTAPLQCMCEVLGRGQHQDQRVVLPAKAVPNPVRVPRLITARWTTEFRGRLAGGCCFPVVRLIELLGES